MEIYFCLCESVKVIFRFLFRKNVSINVSNRTKFDHLHTMKLKLKKKDGQ